MRLAAGKMTTTNWDGVVAALPIGFFLANIDVLHLGARSVNPKFETRVVFTGTFQDPGKEATSTNALHDQGVDFMAMIADSPITVMQIVERRVLGRLPLRWVAEVRAQRLDHRHRVQLGYCRGRCDRPQAVWECSS